MFRIAVRFLVPAVLVAGCGDDDAGPAASGTPVPPVSSGVGASTTGNSDTTGAASETAADSAPTGGLGTGGCAACGDDESCVADHQSGVTDPDLLEFTCRSGADACVAPGDGSLWCGNDSACCEGLCDEFGRCDAGTLTGSGTGGSGSDGSSSGSTGAGSSSGSTGAGSSSGSTGAGSSTTAA